MALTKTVSSVRAAYIMSWGSSPEWAVVLPLTVAEREALAANGSLVKRFIGFAHGQPRTVHYAVATPDSMVLLDGDHALPVCAANVNTVEITLTLKGE